jgi:putative phage-type endonuclease
LQLTGNEETHRETWLAERRKGIGGTDVAAICGVHPYCSPAKVFAEKLGLVETPENAPMRWGRRLEGAVAAEYGECEGKKVILLSDQIVARKVDGVDLFGSPDAVVWPTAPTPDDLLTVEAAIANAERGLEIKTASPWAKGWGDGGADIPQHYFVQCQWYMAMTGLKLWDLAVLIGGSDFRIYRLQAHERLQATLIEKAIAFWKNHIEPQIMPDPDASADFRKAVEARLPARAEPVLATDIEDELAEKLRAAKVAAAAADDQVRLLQNQLLAKMEAKSTTGMISEQWKATSVNMPGRKSTDWKQLQKDLGITKETLAKYEKVGQNYRVFRFDWKGDEE